MTQRSLPVLLLLVLLLAACASLTPQPIAAVEDPAPLQPTVDDPPQPTTAEDTPAPTATLAPTATPTPLGEEVVVLTNEPPDIILTAMSLQLEQNQVRLTEAANQIATLSADSNQLETQVAAAKTQTAATANPGSSGNNNPTNSKYTIPGNVYTVVTTDSKTFVFIEKTKNKNGAPIMGFYEPRTFLEAGSEAWVYKSAVKVDGGELYYESYDPDGSAPPFKIYFRGKHIQIRLPNGSPNPANYPANVAKAKVTSKVAVHRITGYDNKDKPIMDTYKPYIHYNAGDSVILYPKYVIATGGSYWYAIYDSDGKPSGYLPATRVTFPASWD